MTKNREGQVTMEPLLRAVNLTKHFGGLVAVDGVSFDVNPGEVIGLVGDNGAGKSTFIKMISGVYQPDGGEIYFDGKKVNFIDPRDARDMGIETIYQDLALAENLDVGSNIFLGREMKKRFISEKLSQIIFSVVFALPLGALLAWAGLQFYKIPGLALGLMLGLACRRGARLAVWVGHPGCGSPNHDGRIGQSPEAVGYRNPIAYPAGAQPFGRTAPVRRDRALDLLERQGDDHG